MSTPSHPSPFWRRAATSFVSLAVAAVAVIGLSVSGSPTAAADTPAAKPTIVLVHGAWADSSSWSDVVGRLQRSGYRVVAPPNPLRGVASDTASLTAFLRTIPGPVVLAGHSYGGFVVTNAAASSPNVRARVYIDGYIPDTGETLKSLGGKFPGSKLDPSAFDYVPQANGPDAYVKTSLFRAAIANDLPSGRAATLAAIQRPLSAAAFEEPSSAPAASPLPTYALIGTEDNAIPEATQEFMARRVSATILVVRASHLSLISRADRTADLIVAAARKVG